MSIETTVYAYSPSTGQEVRMFNLENQQNIPMGFQAEQQADSFCIRLNQQRYLHVADWQPRLKQEDLGIHTFILAQNALTPTPNNGQQDE
jgi:hypothetical protein